MTYVPRICVFLLLCMSCNARACALTHVYVHVHAHTSVNARYMMNPYTMPIPEPLVTPMTTSIEDRDSTLDPEFW